MTDVSAYSPRLIRVHARDNVAIVANTDGLRAGTPLDATSTLVEDIPEGHKLALVDIEQGAPVYRYGVPIGFAARPIARGAWVHEGNLCLPEAPDLENLPMATEVPPELEPMEGCTFEGVV